MAIERITFHTYNKSVGELVRGLSDGDLTGDVPYQRGLVWDDDQRLALVEHMLADLPGGILYLNRRNDVDPDVIVDGKQRLDTFARLLDDRLEIPTAWLDNRAERPGAPWVPHDHDAATITHGQLTRPGRLRLSRGLSIQVYLTEMPTEDDERRLYLRVNTSGVRHTDNDLARARA